jgi:hypothetical protein
MHGTNDKCHTSHHTNPKLGKLALFRKVVGAFPLKKYVS